MTLQTDIAAVKRWWRSRTIWLGAHLMAAAPVLEYVRDHSQMLHHYIGEADSAVSFALGALIVYLRNKTTTPIGKRSDPTNQAGA
ncbi:hypothetical protein [Dyella lutea]|uniref:Holin n=1 Tax=Dyella lutea TaxID=2950441 RepID=A0ABT1FFB9_9GAMM|nr:hypothetical protein [Dyella lutea]MCP1376029.1 hypothetical protein [Dyella lutea]